MGLKESKDLCEKYQETQKIVIDGTVTDLALNEHILTLRQNGCKVGEPVHELLQSLRNLGSEALQMGEDELANEILQLVLAEKLRRGPDGFVD
jgi:HPt (histidine-containing phosphotransfer) domain-containing protein